MSDTVDVTVKLPPAPEGYKWIAKEMRTNQPAKLNFWGKQTEWVLGLEPIQPATVMVELPTETAKRFGNSLYNTLDMVALNDACRAAFKVV